VTNDGSLVLWDNSWEDFPGRWVRGVGSVDKDIDSRARCPVGGFRVENLLDVGSVEVDFGLGVKVGEGSC
jgi:hypothetical protein